MDYKSATVAAFFMTSYNETVLKRSHFIWIRYPPICRSQVLSVNENLKSCFWFGVAGFDVVLTCTRVFFRRHPDRVEVIMICVRRLKKKIILQSYRKRVLRAPSPIQKR